MKLKKGVIIICSIIFVIVFAGLFTEDKAYAAVGKVTINTVDYENENVIVNNNDNERIYFSTDAEAAKDKWEVLDADPGATTSIDFSWLSASVDNVLVFKGDKDSTQTSVKILKKTQKLEVSISYTKVSLLSDTDTIGVLLNVMTTAGNADEPVVYDDLEWRKGSSGKWLDMSTFTYRQLKKLQIKGADVYFRIKAINDTTVADVFPDGSKGNRASNEMKLKIAKKAMAAVVGVDGTKYLTDISYGKEYRMAYSTAGGLVQSDWIQITDKAVKKLKLEEMFLQSGYTSGTPNGVNIKFPAVFIEIRNFTTSKADSSKITEIELDEQRELEGDIIEQAYPEEPTAEDMKKIYVGYIQNKNMTLQIPLASTANPYEYCISKTSVLDPSKAVWTSVTKSTAIKIGANKAIDGGYLFVRQKEVKYKAASSTTAAVGYELASTCKVYEIDYPALPIIDKQTLSHIRKYSDDMKFTITTHKGTEKPYETKVASLKIGSKALNFTQISVWNDDASNPIYGIEVTIPKGELDISAVCRNKVLTVTFENGFVNKTSLKITIQDPIKALDLGMDTPKPGTAVGSINFKASLAVGASNKLVYVVSDTEVKDVMTAEKIITGTAFTSPGDIVVPVNKYITFYEINSVTQEVVKFRCIQVKDEHIKK